MLMLRSHSVSVEIILSTPVSNVEKANFFFAVRNPADITRGHFQK